ncbi:MAG: 3-deoxy-manno-octulosonate cytidylyltransferase [Bacteroidia bacterium]|nr:3-deoxy-manno-octulosonate cytidylyltransferase [Bacteroidia bacterium]
MKILGVIPARFASTRFFGKPLIDIGGKTMIQRVYEQACKASALSKVIIATDDDRIYNHAIEIGANVTMTSTQHQSGTDRCAEVAAQQFEEYEVVINIQGDEPFIHPEQINELAQCFANTATKIATLVKKINNTEDLKSNTVMKVALTNSLQALYFSRNAIPYKRGTPIDEWLQHFTYYKHIGIYGFRTATLKEVTALAPSTLELTESLEQLRWLQNDYKIQVAVTELESVSIDTPEDLLKIKF